jgi:Protein of unknown function (DUF3618)
MGQTADELRRDIEETRSDLGSTLDAIGDRLSPGRIVERRKNRVRRALGRMREQVMGSESTPTALADRAGSAASSAADAARHAPEAIRERTEGNPLMAGALALGAGFLVATVLPMSRKEKDLGGEVREKAQPVVDELTEAGREAAEHLKEPARQAAGEVKSTARESAEELKSTAKDGAHEVSDSARGGGRP